MSKKALYWICQIIGWSLHAFYKVFILISIFKWNDLTYKPFFSILWALVISIFLTHCYRYYIKRHQWIKLNYIRLIPKVLIASLLLSVTHFFIEYTFSYFLNLSYSRSTFQLEDFLFTGIVSVAGLLIVHFGWSLIYFLYHYIEQQKQSLKDEAALKDFELNKLKSQLNPHFIFNALNSIRALVDEDPSKCKEAINQLSNILRNSLLMDRQKLIPFSEELKAVKDYLALETIRFEERLNSELNIDPQTFNYKVPPLMIQTLVENGIKHGISKLKEGGILQLETKINERSELVILIKNSGIFKLNNTKPEGHGLMNTKRRLKLLYGNDASFNIENHGENMVLTEVIIPKIFFA